MNEPQKYSQRKTGVPIEKILPDKDNLEIAVDSIRKGHLSEDKRPVEVYEHPEGYVLADGHHRLLQKILAGEKKIDVNVREAEQPPSLEGSVRLDPSDEHYGLREALENGWLLKRLRMSRHGQPRRYALDHEMVNSLLQSAADNPSDQKPIEILADHLEESGMGAHAGLLRKFLSQSKLAATESDYIRSDDGWLRRSGLRGWRLAAWPADLRGRPAVDEPDMQMKVALIHRDNERGHTTRWQIAMPRHMAKGFVDGAGKEGAVLDDSVRFHFPDLGLPTEGMYTDGTPPRQPHRYARLTLAAPRPVRHISGEPMFEHDYHDESGQKVGVVRVIPRNNGQRLHINWAGAESVGGGEVANIHGVGIRQLLPQLAQHYPQAHELTGLRLGGARKGTDRPIPIPGRARPPIDPVGKDELDAIMARIGKPKQESRSGKPHRYSLDHDMVKSLLTSFANKQEDRKPLDILADHLEESGFSALPSVLRREDINNKYEQRPYPGHELGINRYLINNPGYFTVNVKAHGPMEYHEHADRPNYEIDIMHDHFHRGTGKWQHPIYLTYQTQDAGHVRSLIHEAEQFGKNGDFLVSPTGHWPESHWVPSTEGDLNGHISHLLNGGNIPGGTEWASAHGGKKEPEAKEQPRRYALDHEMVDSLLDSFVASTKHVPVGQNRALGLWGAERKPLEIMADHYEESGMPAHAQMFRDGANDYFDRTHTANDEQFSVHPKWVISYHAGIGKDATAWVELRGSTPNQNHWFGKSFKTKPESYEFIRQLISEGALLHPANNPGTEALYGEEAAKPEAKPKEKPRRYALDHEMIGQLLHSAEIDHRDTKPLDILADHLEESGMPAHASVIRNHLKEKGDIHHDLYWEIAHAQEPPRWFVDASDKHLPHDGNKRVNLWRENKSGYVTKFANILPDDQALALVDALVGEGARISGTSNLVRKKIRNSTEPVPNWKKSDARSTPASPDAEPERLQRAAHRLVARAAPASGRDAQADQTRARCRTVTYQAHRRSDAAAGDTRRDARDVAGGSDHGRLNLEGEKGRRGEGEIRRYAAGKHGTPQFSPEPYPGNDPAKRDSDPLWMYHRGLIDYSGRRQLSSADDRRDMNYTYEPPNAHAVIVGGHQSQTHREGDQIDRSVPLPEGFEYWGDASARYRHGKPSGSDYALADNPNYSVREIGAGRRVEHTIAWPRALMLDGTRRDVGRPMHSAIFPLQDLVSLAKPSDPYRIFAASILGGNRHAIPSLVHLLKQRDNPAGWWKGWADLHRRMEREQGDLRPEEVATRLHKIASATKSESSDPEMHDSLAKHAYASVWPTRDAIFTGKDWQGWHMLADHITEHGLEPYANLIRTELMNVMPELRGKPKGRRRFSRNGQPRRYALDRQMIHDLFESYNDDPEKKLKPFEIMADHFEESGMPGHAELVRKAVADDPGAQGTFFHFHAPQHHDKNKIYLQMPSRSQFRGSVWMMLAIPADKSWYHRIGARVIKDHAVALAAKIRSEGAEDFDAPQRKSRVRYARRPLRLAQVAPIIRSLYARKPLRLAQVAPEFKFSPEERTQTIPIVAGHYINDAFGHARVGTHHPLQEWMGFQPDAMGSMEGAFYRANRRKNLLTPLGLELAHLRDGQHAMPEHVRDTAAHILKHGLKDQKAFHILADQLEEAGHSADNIVHRTSWRGIPRTLWAEDRLRHVGRVYRMDPGQLGLGGINDSDVYHSMIDALSGKGFKKTIDGRDQWNVLTRQHSDHPMPPYYYPNHDYVEPGDEGSYLGEELHHGANFVQDFHDPEVYRGHMANIAEHYGQPPEKYARRRYAAPQTQQTFAGSQSTVASKNQDVKSLVAQDIFQTLQLLPAYSVDAIHQYPDGSRPALTLRADNKGDADKATYAAAWLGLMARMPGQVVFHVGEGDDLLHRFQSDLPMRQMHQLLDRVGVKDRTVIPRRGSNEYVIFDREAKIGAGLRDLVSKLGAQLNTIKGNGNFIGSTGDATEAREAYRRIIRGYEAKVQTAEAGSREEVRDQKPEVSKQPQQEQALKPGELPEKLQRSWLEKIVMASRIESWQAMLQRAKPNGVVVRRQAPVVVKPVEQPSNNHQTVEVKVKVEPITNNMDGLVASIEDQKHEMLQAIARQQQQVQATESKTKEAIEQVRHEIAESKPAESAPVVPTKRLKYKRGRAVAIIESDPKTGQVLRTRKIHYDASGQMTGIDGA